MRVFVKFKLSCTVFATRVSRYSDTVRGKILEGEKIGEFGEF